jgi:GTP cyclohydrolase II
MISVETATPGVARAGSIQWARAPRCCSADSGRAALSLGNERDAADPPSRSDRAHCGWLDAATARDARRPGQDFERAPIGPLAGGCAAGSARPHGAALTLAGWPGCCRRLWLLERRGGDCHPDRSRSHRAVKPQPASDDRRPRRSFRSTGLDPTQIVAFARAMTAGACRACGRRFGGKPPLVRLHSECLTGDVFGSLKCDCGPQLRSAAADRRRKAAASCLYLRQEGRGIGLANKLRAYALQDRGSRHGRRQFPARLCRRRARLCAWPRQCCARWDRPVRLLTNNPAKVAGLEAQGIAVANGSRITCPPIRTTPTILRREARKSGHLDSAAPVQRSMR